MYYAIQTDASGESLKSRSIHLFDTNTYKPIMKVKIN